MGSSGTSRSILIPFLGNDAPTVTPEPIAAGEVSGVVSIRPRLRGFRQDPPLRVLVESGGSGAADDLAARITARLREAMLVSTEITVVPLGSLPRSDYKSKLVDWSDAAQ